LTTKSCVLKSDDKSQSGDGTTESIFPEQSVRAISVRMPQKSCAAREVIKISLSMRASCLQHWNCNRNGLWEPAVAREGRRHRSRWPFLFARTAQFLATVVARTQRLATKRTASPLPRREPAHERDERIESQSATIANRMTSGVAASHGVETKSLIVSMVVTQGRLMSEPALCPDLACCRTVHAP
jgi:hypothetical protein